MNKFALLAILLACVACKSDEGTEPSDNAPIQFGYPLVGERVLRESEAAMAKRQCEALREVGIRYDLARDKEIIFKFKTSNLKCGTSTFTYSGDYEAYLRKDVRGEFSFEGIGRSARLLEDVVTDKQGLMNDLCDDILANREAKNIYDMSGGRYLYRFLTTGGLDTVEIARYVENTDGKFLPRSIESYQIFTSGSTNNSAYWGLVKERAQALPCNGTNGIQTFKQELLSTRNN
jgi:hypothetical protein